MSKAIAIVAIVGVIATATLLIMRPPLWSERTDTATSTMGVATTTLPVTVQATSTPAVPKKNSQNFWQRLFGLGPRPSTSLTPSDALGTPSNVPSNTTTSTSSVPSGATTSSSSSGAAKTTTVTTSKTTTSSTKPPLPSYLPNVLDKEIPKGFTREQLSPYFKQIKMTVAKGSARSHSVIRITASYLKEMQAQRVNITGWLIQAKRGSHEIGQAIHTFLLDMPNYPGNILLGHGERVTISSATNPLGDPFKMGFSNANNIRTNKCFGYLTRTYTFHPSLSASCPARDKEEISTFSGQCQKIINSVPACKSPTTQQFNLAIGQGNEACFAYLNTLNYNSCVYEHRLDADFFGKEWRVWTNYNFPDFYRDTVNLFDEKGLLVAQYIY